MKEDRFLLIILGVIGLLAISALSLFFIRRESQTYVPDDSPEGVLRNYIIALILEDYEKAYSYLQDTETTPPFKKYKEKLNSRRERINRTAVKIISIDISGEEAKIKVVLTREGRDPFDSSYSSDHSVQLVRQNTVWKLEKIPYPFGY